MEDIAQFQKRLAEVGYIADKPLAATLLLTERLGRPLLLEGEAGVGKTEVAKALARANGHPLIRLQCYEGLDVNAAVYEWNYQRQLLSIQMGQLEGRSEETEDHLFSEQFLLSRPLLQAIRSPERAVLLVDEIDRADEEFEAYLLEVLSDFQISVPELGTLKAVHIPRVVLTSNATRELSDALRRRCLYHYLEFPDFGKELRILQAHLPGMSERLAGQMVAFVQRLRALDLRKKPGVAETLDWAAALAGLEVDRLEVETVAETLGCLLKTREDQASVPREVLQRLAGEAGE
ncbi:AAA family ATPase [Thiohalorhabdus sp. Cl-TMA]|uniref:AAA family ATPase n=1 Tax=Thiohalorhabdus methylotrophus TaxID=3242694 RepID=A0ABV4TTI6_9GAMM